MSRSPNFNYHGLIASTWDLWRDNTSGWEDRRLFLDIVRQYGQPVLDVGCATGRILLDFLAQGIDIDGVDNSPEMLAICRDKASRMGLAPKLYLQNMELLDLPRNYRTILVASSSFQLLTETDKAREAMWRFVAHLQSGGALIMPFFFDWKEGAPLDVGWRLLFEKTWYEREMVDLLEQRALAGSDLWNLRHDQRNAIIYEENRNRSLDDVREEERVVFNRLVAALQLLDGNELNDAAHFREMPPDWIPWKIIAENSYEHYHQHIPDIRAWLEK